MKIAVYHKPEKKWFWWDLGKNGMYYSSYIGSGFLTVLPAGEEREIKDRNIRILDPMDCEIYPLISAYYCCHLDCGKNTPADWVITTGGGPDDSTHSCNKHAKELSDYADMPEGYPVISPIDNLCDVVNWKKNKRIKE